MPEDYHTNEIAGTSRHRKRIGSDYSKLNSILGRGGDCVLHVILVISDCVQCQMFMFSFLASE